MTRLPREPLDADERALAARLPRLHGRDEPDAGLDARILAAAHAALGPGPIAKRRRGWIVPLTAAASVSLAVGLAWQLQPPTAPSVSAAPPLIASADQAGNGEQAVMRSIEAAPARTADAMQSRPMPRVSPPPQAAPVEDNARIARESAPATSVAEVRADAPVFVPSPPSEAAMADAMSVEVMAPPPAPPAPPAPAAPAPALPQAAMGRVAATEEAISVSGTRVKPQAKRIHQGNEAEAAADAATLDTFANAIDEEDVPPATMDAPAARDAWLRRIGELQQQGKVDEAKASLAEFRRRYPDAVLPPELRKLEP
ncbi:hypothetical protein [Thermomonas carbonis]|uniref:Tetratricopeptide repeat protein n=1 Tax=Thermomonas carbonis TaxID=1463158 RepID=A0A7G9SMW6_9GAMM|nr:hypothetical protein [Thermomonas carbonis]QNN69191.1 hypothetical protein H9L16_10855 [Thermomonas carbonis]GHC06163.1 hypothetical protein GCM10010080_20230 [Thermomonas carbonis]